MLISQMLQKLFLLKNKESKNSLFPLITVTEDSSHLYKKAELH